MYKPANIDYPTPPQVITTMCNRLEPAISNIHKTVFDAGCGTGGFLLEVLKRRLRTAQPSEPEVLYIASKLYGADIKPEYVSETRSQIKSCIQNFFTANFFHHYLFWPQLENLLSQNIFVADLTSDPAKISVIEWEKHSDFFFSASRHTLKQLLDTAEK